MSTRNSYTSSFILIDDIILVAQWEISSIYLRPQAAQLYFRGQRIWSAAMEELMSKGMRYANQVLVKHLDNSSLLLSCTYSEAFSFGFSVLLPPIYLFCVYSRLFFPGVVRVVWLLYCTAMSSGIFSPVTQESSAWVTVECSSTRKYSLRLLCRLYTHRSLLCHRICLHWFCCKFQDGCVGETHFKKNVQRSG